MVGKFELKYIVQFFAYVLLLIGTVTFGLLGKPAEMGLAIVAAAIALAFSDIERFSKIKGAGFEAELRKQVEAVVDKETEIPPVEEKEGASPFSARVDKKTMAVVEALGKSDFTWRYFSGIKKDTALDDKEVRSSLEWLTANGFVRRSQGKHGPIWSLTEEGRGLYMLS